MIGLGSDKNNYGFMWPIDCTKDTIKNRGSTVNIWRIKLSISSIFRSVKTSCLCKIPSAKKNIFLLQKFSVFSFSSYIFFFSEYFPPFPSPIFLLRSSSRYQNVKMSKFQCPHSISRTCLAQEFGLVYAFLALFWPLYGLFGPFLTLFNEKNIIFSPFRKNFPGKA